MLPDNIQKEIRDRRHLNTTQAVLDYLNGELARYQDVHLSKLQDRLDGKGLQDAWRNPVAMVAETDQPKPSSDAEIGKLKTELDAVVNALSQLKAGAPPPPTGTRPERRLPKPDPKFKGCWHCGKEGCNRRRCPSFRALIKQHKGLPKDCEGAYERFLKANNKNPASALTSAQEDAAEIITSFQPAREPAQQEHAETVPIFAVVEHPGPHSTASYFQAIASQDEDYTDLINAVNNLTQKIQLGPKPGQKVRKATRLSKEKIASIAKDVQDGKITLPELDLPTDSDYVRVWALVDSGSSVHVVNASKIFPKATIAPPPKGHKGFTGAGGHRILHKGTVQTVVQTQEGKDRRISWKHADVEMPILSTHELARNGSRLEYDELDGVIRNKATGDETKFYQTGGVYFVPLLVSKDITVPFTPEGFGRQG